MSGHFEHGAWIETKPDETITFENCQVYINEEVVPCKIFSVSFKPTYDDELDKILEHFGDSVNVKFSIPDHIRFEKGKSIGWSDQFREALPWD
jgi:hypothetical protein